MPSLKECHLEEVSRFGGVSKVLVDKETRVKKSFPRLLEQTPARRCSSCPKNVTSERPIVFFLVGGLSGWPQPR